MHTDNKSLIGIGLYYDCPVHVVVAVFRSCGVGSLGVGTDLDFLGSRIAAHEVADEVFSLLRRELVRARFAWSDC